LCGGLRGTNGLGRFCGLDSFRRSGLELNCRAHARFHSTGYEDPLQAAAPKLRTIRFKRVFTGFERRKMKSAISRSDRMDLGAIGLIAQSDRDAGKRRRVQIGEASGK
jgi:hypothetical protein